MQVKSRVVLFSWHVNKKLKTKLNDFLKKWFQTQKEFRQSSFWWRNDPARAKQMSSNVLFVGKKTWRPCGTSFVRQTCSCRQRWVNNHNHFLSTYLTVKLRGPVNRYHIAITNHLQFNKKLSGCLWHPNYRMGLLSRKKDKIADDSPTRRLVSHSPFSWGRFLLEGDGYFRSSGEQIWKSIWNKHKITAWSYWPYIHS